MAESSEDDGCIADVLGCEAQKDNPALAVQKNWYETTARLRFAFYVFNALTVLLAITLGFIVRIFFKVIGATVATRAVAINLHIMPLLLLASAVLVDEMLDLGLDGMGWPAFAIFRATVTTSLSTCFPDFTTWGAEVIVVFLLEGMPLFIVFLYGLTSYSLTIEGMVTAYLLGGLLCVFILTIIYIIAHVHVESSQTKENQMANLYPRVGHLGSFRRESPDPGFPDADRASMKQRLTKCCMFVGASLVVNLICWLVNVLSKGKMMGLMLFGELLIIAFFWLAIRAVAPKLLGKAFWFTFGLFLITTVALWFGASSELPEKEKSELPPLCLGPTATGFAAEGEADIDLPVTFLQPPINGEGAGYPVCGNHWGNRNMTFENQFGILDLAALAFASSFPARDDVAVGLEKMFNGTSLSSWELTYVEDPETIGRWIVVDFPVQKTRVIAVRGTSSLLDVYADLEIYATVSIFQFMNRLTPIINFLGTQRIRNLIATQLLIGEDDFWDRFVDKTATYKQEALAKGWSIVVTGHSLGGALAGTASAKHLIQGVGFSAPGLYYQTARMGIDEQELQYAFTEIQPSGDAVPRADVQMGSVNWIRCALKPGACHRLTKSSCELWRRCGDPRGRDWRETCKTWYVTSDLNL